MTYEASTHGERPDHVLGGVAEHLDQFIAVYLKANADAC